MSAGQSHNSTFVVMPNCSLHCSVMARVTLLASIPVPWVIRVIGGSALAWRYLDFRNSAWALHSELHAKLLDLFGDAGLTFTIDHSVFISLC